jgi:hypothetical protein
MLGSARSVLMKKANPDALPGSAMALYSLNEGSGLTSADSSGNNRTLTLNGASWDASGHTGAALTNTTTNQGAKAGFPSTPSAITIMGWVKPLNLTAGTTHFAFGFIDAGSNTSVAIFTQRADFGTPNVLQGNIRIASSLKSLPAPALTVGVWTHTALTYDGATITLYRNGVSAATLAAAGVINTIDFICIAGGDTNGNYDSDVVVDDVRVYDSALTAGQIVTGMNTPVA